MLIEIAFTSFKILVDRKTERLNRFQNRGKETISMNLRLIYNLNTHIASYVKQIEYKRKIIRK